MKIATALTTFVICIAAAVFVTFFMLIAMNGFSEAEASRILWIFSGLSIITSVIAAVAASRFFSRFTAKGFGPFGAFLVAVMIASSLGVMLELAESFGSIMLAEMMRKG